MDKAELKRQNDDLEGYKPGDNVFFYDFASKEVFLVNIKSTEHDDSWWRYTIYPIRQYFKKNGEIEEINPKMAPFWCIKHKSGEYTPEQESSQIDRWEFRRKRDKSLLEKTLSK